MLVWWGASGYGWGMEGTSGVAAPSSRVVAINLVGYQIGWFAAIFAGAWAMPWLGPLVTIPLLALHLKLAEDPWPETRLLAAAALIGLVADTLLVLTGRITFASGTMAGFISPLWMIGLWALFATALNISLRWLRGRWLLCALLGGLGGPAAYFAGVKLGAAVMHPPLTLSLAAVGLVWGTATPLLVALSQRLDGFCKR